MGFLKWATVLGGKAPGGQRRGGVSWQRGRNGGEAVNRGAVLRDGAEGAVLYVPGQ